MVEELLQNIEEMGEDEFREFRRYYMEVVNDFMTQRYPENGLEEAEDNIRKLEERGGNAIVIGELDNLFRNAYSPEEYSKKVSDYIENSGYADKIETTMDEVMTPFFDEEKELDYNT